jgi:hypothetical protein
MDWAEVSSEAPSDLWRRGRKLNLNSGKSITLQDIPADPAAAISSIGDKPIAAPQSVTNRPARLVRPRTDVEIAANVRRRAAELAVQRQQLAENQSA